MLINVNKVLTNLQGKPVVQETKLESGEIVKKESIVGTLIVEALMAVYEDEAKCSAEDKLKRFRLASKIYDHIQANSAIELTVDEVSFIKNYVQKAGFGPLGFGRLSEILEGA